VGCQAQFSTGNGGKRIVTRQEYLRNYRLRNREKRAEYNKAWWANNPDKSREYAAKRREANPDENKLKMQAWRAKNPERAKAIGKACYWRNPEKRRALARTYPFKRDAEAKEHYRKWAANKRKTDPIYKLISNFRSRLNSILRGRSKSAPTLKLLGCSLDNFKIHLESFFEPGMHWGNYGNKKGQWSCDHVMPFAIFDLSKPEHQRRVCHFSNLRPMWHVENMKKHAKPITDQFNLL
jgi:hypothetical protein